MNRVLFLALAAALCAVLAACATGTGPSAAPAGSAPSTASTGPAASTLPDARTGARPPTAPPVSPLAAEQRYLEDWFRGTPVVIAEQAPAGLQIEVPLANSFNAGKADIKPALNAVLERVAESLRRQVGARIAVTAPADANGVSATLSAQRTVRLREALAARRVATTRITLGDAPRPGGPVQLRMFIPPPPVARLDDSHLLLPANGVKPAAAEREAPTPKRP